MANTLSELVDSIAAIARMEASPAAHKAELIDQARQWSEVSEGASSPGGWSPEVRARRVLVTELACALRIPERAAETLDADSQTLLTDLPTTFAALSEGSISWRHAHVLVDHAISLGPGSVPAFEAAALPLDAHRPVVVCVLPGQEGRS